MLLSVTLWGAMTLSQLAGRDRVVVTTAGLIAAVLEPAGLLALRADPEALSQAGLSWLTDPAADFGEASTIRPP